MSRQYTYLCDMYHNLIISLPCFPNALTTVQFPVLVSSFLVSINTPPHPLSGPTVTVPTFRPYLFVGPILTLPVLCLCKSVYLLHIPRHFATLAFYFHVMRICLLQKVKREALWKICVTRYT